MLLQALFEAGFQERSEREAKRLKRFKLPPAGEGEVEIDLKQVSGFMGPAVATMILLDPAWSL